MEDTLMECLKVLLRIFTILPLLLVVTLFMGKRTIGELPIFDFLIVITLGSIVGADIADPSISHIFTVIAIIAIAVLQKVVVLLKLRNHKFGKLITFEPTIVVHNGKMIQKNIKDIGYTIDNILEMLREKNVFDVSKVETAIIEANGKLSVLKKPDEDHVTKKDMGITSTSSLALPVIIEGSIHSKVLQQYNVNEVWLKEELQKRGVDDIRNVFFASVDNELQINYSLKNEVGMNLPPIGH